MRYELILLSAFLCINIASFLVNCIDKYKAKHGKWRIPEATLWLFALFGGATGGYIAMRTIRHKTKHKSFMTGMPILMIIQLTTFAYIFKRLTIG